MSKTNSLRPRASVRLEQTGKENVLNVAVGADAIYAAFGSPSRVFAAQELTRLANALRSTSSGPSEDEVNAALAVIDGAEPKSEIGALLVSQMVITHVVALEMMGRAKRADTVERAVVFGGLATKFSRTFALQCEALAKLQRGGEQVVRVEHVHVHSGGQAIVGPVGVTHERGNQSGEPLDQRAIAFAPGSPVLGEESTRAAVPAAVRERQEALPSSRRRRGDRGAQR